MEGLMNFLQEAFSTPSYQIGAMAVTSVFFLIFIVSKRFLLAFVLFGALVIFFLIWLSGPMGTEMIEKYQGKYSPTFHSADE